jgi:hypothetical protein
MKLIQTELAAAKAPNDPSIRTNRYIQALQALQLKIQKP